MTRAGRRWIVRVAAVFVPLVIGMRAADSADDTAASDRNLAAFFADETSKIERACLDGIRTCEDWESSRAGLRARLFDMLGLDPAAGREAIAPVVTGRIERDGIVVERIHFQSRPGLYVTGNLYRLAGRPARATADGQRSPAVLYLCGHARVVENDVSLGNKTHYQHHGAWLARHGYVALLIDTLQLGEIEGIHHGTYREGRWWWPSRGYTPAGVEAWNALVAIDYLASRPEVDPRRIGVTGRSGGGATSWWTVALDESVRAAVPVAGITDLRDHVVNGCVAGHCDCMFIVNTYRWDYPMVAALAHPRALLLANTDRDGIFPLGGVMRTHERVARLYGLCGKSADFSLVITPGGHVDSQEIQLPAMRWFDAHLGGGERSIDSAARGEFSPHELKVFDGAPADQRNTSIDESFVPKAGPFATPASAAAWRTQAEEWRRVLLDKTFRGWPQDDGPPRLLDDSPGGAVDGEGVAAGLVCRSIRFESQPHVPLDLILMHRTDLESPELVVLDVVDEEGWGRFDAVRRSLFAGTGTGTVSDGAPARGAGGDRPDEARRVAEMLRAHPWAVATLAPRGVGPTRWNPDPTSLVHVRRRFLLLGQTWEGMQAYDIRRGLQVLRTHVRLGGAAPGEVPVHVRAHGGMAVLTAHASLFEPPVERLDLHAVPPSHDRPGTPDGATAPSLLNVLRTLDVPQTIALAADRARVVLHDCDERSFGYVRDVARVVGWSPQQVEFHPPEKTASEGVDDPVAASPAPRPVSPFHERTIDPHAGEICYAVTLADVDGDSRDDIVVVTEKAVVWYRNPGEGDEDVWQKRSIVDERTPRDNVCIAAHDIDGDGAVDFALGAGWTKNGSLHWLARDGSHDRPWRVHDIGPLPSAHRMRWADVLGTGRPQLVVSPLVAGQGESGVRLTAYAVPAKPATDRWPAIVLDRSMNRMHGHTHVDLDGDGRTDTLTASREGLGAVRRDGDGRDAGFGARPLGRGAEAETPDACGAGEVEYGRLADGTAIIATVEPMHGSAIAVYTPADPRLNAAGPREGPWRRTVIDEGYSRGHAIALVDLDGDGGDEIVFGSSDPSTKPGYGPTLAVYTLATDGAAPAAAADPHVPSSWHRTLLDAGGVAVEAVAVSDLTGDGLPDIVAVGRGTHNVKLFINARK